MNVLQTATTIRGSYDDALYKSTYTLLYFTINSLPLPGLAKWIDIKVSALGSRVG